MLTANYAYYAYSIMLTATIWYIHDENGVKRRFVKKIDLQRTAKILQKILKKFCKEDL